MTVQFSTEYFTCPSNVNHEAHVFVQNCSENRLKPTNPENRAGKSFHLQPAP